MSEVPLFQVQNEEQNNNSSGNQNNNNITRTKSKRIEALDAFRGLTVIVMILVDNAGGAFPEIDHSPGMVSRWLILLCHHLIL
jgi:heparan-alpha-glucosaminide N-acetyltransferase